MSIPEFEKVNVSDDQITPNDNPSSDLACEVCGVPVVYAGNGRKPKYCEEHRNTRKSSGASTGRSRGGAGRSTGTVEQAIATLGNLYDLIGMAFYLAEPDAARVWTGNVSELQTRNRAILSADPELTRAINRLGVKGGKFAFAAVQLSAITPPALIALNTQRTKAAERQAKARREQMRRNSGAQPGGTQDQATGTDGFPPDMGNRGFFG